MWLVYISNLQNPLIQHHTPHNTVITASEITSHLTYCSATFSLTSRKHQSPALLVLLRWNQRWLVDSPHKGPVMWKVSPCHDIILTMECCMKLWLGVINTETIKWYIWMCHAWLVWFVQLFCRQMWWEMVTMEKLDPKILFECHVPMFPSLVLIQGCLICAAIWLEHGPQ